jgi:hypothetical protein
MTVRRILLAVVTFTSLSPLVRAQTRTEITINDTGAQALIQAEGQGRVTELTIKGNRAEVRCYRKD